MHFSLLVYLVDWRMKTEKMIKTARSYLQLLNEIIERKKEVEMLLQLFTCLRLDDNYHLALKDVGLSGIGNNSWLYSYKGNSFKDYSCDKAFDTEKWPDDFIKQSYEIFAHLIVKKTDTGAWQAYLLSIASTLLPAFWHGQYNNRKYLFSEEDVESIPPFFHNFPIPDLSDFKDEELLKPSVWIKDDVAHVSCCYWNYWKGVVRETILFLFDGDRIISGQRIKDRILFKYNCPIDL